MVEWCGLYSPPFLSIWLQVAMVSTQALVLKIGSSLFENGSGSGMGVVVVENKMSYKRFLRPSFVPERAPSGSYRRGSSTFCRRCASRPHGLHARGIDCCLRDASASDVLYSPE